MTYNLKYALDKEDYVAFQLFVAFTSERIKKKRKRSRIMMTIAYIIFGTFIWFTGDQIVGLIFLSLAAVWYLFYPKYVKWRYQKHYNSFVDENFKSHYGIETLTKLLPDEIYSENSKGNTTVKVENITEIFETEMYVFLRMGPGMGLTFPKRKIENIEELREWISYVIENYGIKNQVDLDWSWK